MYQYPLKPNRRQAAVLSSWIGLCCDLYNAALQERRDAYRIAGKRIDYNMQTKELTDLRSSDPDVASVPVEIERSALRRLNRNFESFFRRRNRGEKAGYPRFRSKLVYNSIGLGHRGHAEGNHVYVPKLGLVKFHRYRALAGTVLDVVVGKTAGKWWVNFACDLGSAPAKSPVRSMVGIDLGISNFAVLSNGEVVGNPRFFKSSEEAVAARHRSLDRCQKGSVGRARARVLLGKAYAHVRNQRLDHARKLACSLYSRFDLIVHEDLNIRRMSSGTFSKPINDVGWGLFIRTLTCKAEKAGKWAVPVDPCGTSKRCSRCGNIVDKTLSNRIHSCPCGLVLDRDHNAAINILSLGMSEEPLGLRSP